MRNVLLISILCTLTSWGQTTDSTPQKKREWGENRYPVDSLRRFEEGKNEYYFRLGHSLNYGFFWDTLSKQIDWSHVLFGVINDTDTAVTVTYTNINDGAMNFYLYGTPWRAPRVFQPNDTIWVRVQRYFPGRVFSKRFVMRYTQADSARSFSFMNWGFYQKDRPSKLSAEERKNIRYHKPKTNGVPPEERPRE